MKKLFKDAKDKGDTLDTSIVLSMKKMSVYFTERQFEVITQRAEATGISFAECLRRVLDEWLEYVAQHKEG